MRAADTGRPPITADSVVESYLIARRRDDEADRDESASQSEKRLAGYARRGADDYVMEWGVQSPAHAALIALVAAERIEALVDGYSVGGGGGKPRVLELGERELFEIHRIKGAFLRLWDYLDPRPHQLLKPLADEMGLEV